MGGGGGGGGGPTAAIFSLPLSLSLSLSFLYLVDVDDGDLDVWALKGDHGHGRAFFGGERRRVMRSMRSRESKRARLLFFRCLSLERATSVGGAWTADSTRSARARSSGPPSQWRAEGMQCGRPRAARPHTVGRSNSWQPLRALPLFFFISLTADIARADAADLNGGRRFLVHHGEGVTRGAGEERGVLPGGGGAGTMGVLPREVLFRSLRKERGRIWWCVSPCACAHDTSSPTRRACMWVTGRGGRSSAAATK